MPKRLSLGALATAAVAAVAIGVPVVSAGADQRAADRSGHRDHGEHGIRHVILISVDGMHQSDLDWYVHNHPGSELARLAFGGADYTNAQTPVPSDSFPGMIAQATGGDPRTTGIYYDAEYNHDLLPPGTTTCAPGQPLGTAVTFEESLDKDKTSIDAGQGLAGLPESILSMTGQPQTLINPAALPVDPSTCTPVFPHQYLKVNTIFEVARQAGLRTAWSDKHPAYEILNGPSGTGVEDLFTPEINSNAIGFPGGIDWTGDNSATMEYDSFKVRSVLNEIDGFDHSRTTRVGVPAIFGMNFQTVSTAEKLPTSGGQPGGYLPGTRIPGPVLRHALQYINDNLQAMADELQAQGIANSTAIIISAKHGQSPQDPNTLTRIDDGPIISGINDGWRALHPGAPDLVASATDDDAIQMWLSDRSHAAARFVKQYLLTHSATGNTASGGSRTLSASGLSQLFVGRAAARFFGVPFSDPRHPDVWGIVQHGVVYTGGTGKIAEHGGADPEDRDVPLLVYAPMDVQPRLFRDQVATKQIAPTILRLLGLDPDQLRAVRLEGTQVLPGVH
jgi:Type I phosphodiesterase / nucleotide pyrophosphatase